MTKNSAIALLALSAWPLAAFATRGEAAPPPPQTHTVRMYAEGENARFQPANLTIRAGDRVRFVSVSGGPHNVSFDPAVIPDAAEARISAGMPDQIQPLAGALVIGDGDAYTITFAGVPAGRYPFFCLPHERMRMTGIITVQ